VLERKLKRESSILQGGELRAGGKARKHGQLPKILREDIKQVSARQKRKGEEETVICLVAFKEKGAQRDDHRKNKIGGGSRAEMSDNSSGRWKRSTERKGDRKEIDIYKVLASGGEKEANPEEIPTIHSKEGDKDIPRGRVQSCEFEGGTPKRKGRGKNRGRNLKGRNLNYRLKERKLLSTMEIFYRRLFREEKTAHGERGISVKMEEEASGWQSGKGGEKLLLERGVRFQRKGCPGGKLLSRACLYERGGFQRFLSSKRRRKLFARGGGGGGGGGGRPFLDRRKAILEQLSKGRSTKCKEYNPSRARADRVMTDRANLPQEKKNAKSRPQEGVKDATIVSRQLVRRRTFI